MALSPQYKMNDAGDGMIKVRAHRQAHPAATKYKVLDSSSGCSLVELEPLTGKMTLIFRGEGALSIISAQFLVCLSCFYRSEASDEGPHGVRPDLSNSR